MQFYYGLKTGGFYSTASHGHRTITIDDPTFQRPKTRVPDPAYKPDAGGEGNTVPTVEVDDIEVVVPQITCDNPDCLLPPAVDLIEISVEHYQMLLEAQSQGLCIELDEHRRPSAVAPAGQSIETLCENERCWRNYQLLQTDTIIARHRDELEADQAITLTTAHYKELQVYRAALRTWPEHADFPDIFARPVTPTWLVLP